MFPNWFKNKIKFGIESNIHLTNFKYNLNVFVQGLHIEVDERVFDGSDRRRLPASLLPPPVHRVPVASLSPNCWSGKILNFEIRSKKNKIWNYQKRYGLTDRNLQEEKIKKQKKPPISTSVRSFIPWLRFWVPPKSFPITIFFLG